MKKYYLDVPVVQNVDNSKDLSTLKVKAPVIANNAKPGQFINIYFDNSDRIFPRPFSISQIDDENIIIRYQIVGEQTERLSKIKKGTELQILGPLGKYFDIKKSIKSHILIGGGIGVAPLFFLRDRLYEMEQNIKFFIGTRTEQEHFILSDKKSQLYLSTEDGSKGYEGNVLELLEKEISNLNSSKMIYTCGPESMLKEVKRFGNTNNVPVQISMERIMGCGMGLCQGCAIESSIDEEEYFLICKDGPVFYAEDIKINE